MTQPTQDPISRPALLAVALAFLLGAALTGWLGWSMMTSPPPPSPASRTTTPAP